MAQPSAPAAKKGRIDPNLDEVECDPKSISLTAFKAEAAAVLFPEKYDALNCMQSVISYARKKGRLPKENTVKAQELLTWLAHWLNDPRAKELRGKIISVEDIDRLCKEIAARLGVNNVNLWRTMYGALDGTSSLSAGRFRVPEDPLEAERLFAEMRQEIQALKNRCAELEEENRVWRRDAEIRKGKGRRT